VQATTWHAKQYRKGGAEPYIGHLLGVASLVIEHGGDEKQACAALLHDSIEDCGVSTEELENLFGPDIAAMVVACTDTEPDLPAPQDAETKAKNWGDRKEDYHAKIRAKATLGATSPERRAILVGVCDKINNCEKSVNDSRGQTPTTCGRSSTRAEHAKSGTTAHCSRHTEKPHRSRTACRVWRARSIASSARSMNSSPRDGFPSARCSTAMEPTPGATDEAAPEQELPRPPDVCRQVPNGDRNTLSAMWRRPSDPDRVRLSRLGADKTSPSRRGLPRRVCDHARSAPDHRVPGVSLRSLSETRHRLRLALLAPRDSRH